MMGSQTKKSATPVNQPTRPRTPDVSAPVVLSDMAALQGMIGNAAVMRQPELLSRTLLSNSNRQAVQRWPWSDKTPPLDDAEGQLNTLSMDAYSANSLWTVANTSAAGSTALEQIKAIDKKLKALKTSVAGGKYKTPEDKGRQADFAARADAELSNIAGYITTTTQAVGALKLQEAITATGAASHAGGAAPGPKDPMDKIKDAGRLGGNAYQATSAVERGTRSAQLLGAQNKKAMFDNATGGDLEVNAVKKTGEGGVQGFLDSLSQFVTSIKEKIFNISWVKKLIDFLEPLKNWTFLIGALADAYSLYSTYDRYSALKAGADDASASGSADDLAKSLIYGFAKVKRALYWNITKFGLSLSKSIARIVTLLTGGATALVTESIALAADLASAVMTIGRKAKGIFKAIRGTRGKARGQNAEMIYDSAMKGDKRALKLIIAFKPFGMVASLKDKVSYANIPTAEPEMLTFLHAKSSDRKAIVAAIGDKLKSQ
jgi:hypothetical protein